MKSKTTLRAVRLGVIILTSLILLASSAVAYSNPLNVPFKAQVPPGVWGTATHNCGQTSVLMVSCFYDGTTPTEQGIKDIDDWLYARFGASQAINNYCGSTTTTSVLETLAKERGGNGIGFPLSYKASGWTVARVKQEIDAGHPVIVAVTGAPLGQSYGGHFLVAKGYTSTGIMTNDPGRTSGQLTYTNTQFANAMSSQGGAVLVMLPNPIKITSPSAGNYWSRYTTRTVQWRYTGNPAGGTVSIDLLQGSNTYRITSSAPLGSGGVGSYSWFVMQSPGQYKVRVSINACGPGYTDTSGIFYIG